MWLIRGKMLITITGLKFVTGAQMRHIQAKNGLFIDDDTLVLDVEDSDTATTEWLSALKDHTRRASESEVACWVEVQAARWDMFEKRWDAQRTGESAHWPTTSTIAQLRKRYRRASEPTDT